jgi:hypothetical protein
VAADPRNTKREQVRGGTADCFNASMMPLLRSSPSAAGHPAPRTDVLPFRPSMSETSQILAQGICAAGFIFPHLCALAHVERTITHEFLRDTTTASIAVRAPERIEKVLEEAVACRAEALFGLTSYQPGSLNWIPGGSPRIVAQGSMLVRPVVRRTYFHRARGHPVNKVAGSLHRSWMASVVLAMLKGGARAFLDGVSDAAGGHLRLVPTTGNFEELRAALLALGTVSISTETFPPQRRWAVDFYIPEAMRSSAVAFAGDMLANAIHGPKGITPSDPSPCDDKGTLRSYFTLPDDAKLTHTRFAVDIPNFARVNFHVHECSTAATPAPPRSWAEVARNQRSGRGGQPIPRPVARPMEARARAAGRSAAAGAARPAAAPASPHASTAAESDEDDEASDGGAEIAAQEAAYAAEREARKNAGPRPAVGSGGTFAPRAATSPTSSQRASHGAADAADMRRIVTGALRAIVDGTPSPALAAAIDAAAAHSVALLHVPGVTKPDAARVSAAFTKAFHNVRADEAGYVAALGAMGRTHSAEELASYLLGRDATQAEQVAASLPASLQRDGAGIQTATVVYAEDWCGEDSAMSAAK